MAVEYREFEVPERLRRHVRCVWRLRDPNPVRQAQVIYPDGCCELILHLDAPMQAHDPVQGWREQPACLFAAQQRSAIRLLAGPTVACLGVRLQPAASAAIAGARLVSLRDSIVDLAGIDAALAARLASAMARFDRDPGDPALWSLLASTFAAFDVDARIEVAIDRLQSEGGQVRIASLASLSGMGARSFQIRFLGQVGLSAKEFARVVRLQSTLRQLDSGIGSLANVAAESGFADQAHATRELRQLTGLTPSRLLSALRFERESETTIRLAAAFVRGHAREPMPT
jgi:AraC-like DNA-binding protein